MPLHATLESMRASTGNFDWSSYRPGAAGGQGADAPPPAGTSAPPAGGFSLSGMMCRVAQEFEAFMARQEERHSEQTERTTAVEQRAAALESRAETLETRSGRDTVRLDRIERVGAASQASQRRIDSFFAAIDSAHSAGRESAGTEAPAHASPPAPPPPAPPSSQADGGKRQPCFIDTLSAAELETEADAVWNKLQKCHKKWNRVSKSLNEPMILISRGGQQLVPDKRSCLYVFDHVKPFTEDSRHERKSPFARFAARVYSLAEAVAYRQHVLDKLGFTFEIRGDTYRVQRC